MDNFEEIFNKWEKDNSILNKDKKRDSLKRHSNKQKKKTAGDIPRLDLHGLYKKEALIALDRFIYSNQKKHATCKVIIIHGHGRHSENDPVLKKAVKSWLEMHLDIILDYRPGREGEGGIGATVVTIRQKSGK